MRWAPAHAGRLRSGERLVFALVFTLMATFVVAITVAAARPPRSFLVAGSAAGASEQRISGGAVGSSGTGQSGQGGKQQADGPVGQVNGPPPLASTRLDAHLSAALRKVLNSNGGRLAVGVVDKTTGSLATSHSNRQFRSAGVVTADILAALLYQHQQSGTALTARQADRAVAMVADGNDAASRRMWRAVGGARGLASANRALKLRHTIPGADGNWALTRTTVSDELQLLTDLTSPQSPLAAPARAYELGLMAGPAAGQHWGAYAAGTGRTGYAIKNGSLAVPRLWVINSIGVVDNDGHVLLIAVLTSDNASQAAGIAVASAAAAAAAEVVTHGDG